MNYQLTESQWESIKDIVPIRAGNRKQSEDEVRIFLEAVLWMIKNGSAWCKLPNEYGGWRKSYMRFHSWARKGVWEAIFEILCTDESFSYQMIKSDFGVKIIIPRGKNLSNKYRDRKFRPLIIPS